MVQSYNAVAAARDFHRARRAADLERVMARFTGRSADLLSYEEVRRKLQATTATPRGLQDVPLDAIVGSEGRYTDFTRTFLPKHDSDMDRWTRVFIATSGLEGLPPIEVYQVGSAYFVKDGHHRVSVARQMGFSHLQARVYEVQTRVPLTPDVEMRDVILKAEYARFLERTEIDDLRPEAELGVTVAGQYDRLEEHIQVHRYFMGLDEQRDVSYPEAVAHWYDNVYRPVIAVIRERGLLRDFPDRTETDLYLWLLEHRAELQQALGWEVDTRAAALDLADRFSTRRERVVSRVGEQLLNAVTPSSLTAGPPPGQWRQERVEPRGFEPLFDAILVPLSGDEGSWLALEEALIVARREGGKIFGLHVVAKNGGEPTALSLGERFEARCREAGVPGELVIEPGSVNDVICDRARWTDLVVVKLSYPPGAQPLARLSSGFRSLILHSPRPILAVPQEVRSPDSALLAYDGSPKAREALYVAAYLAIHWEIPLHVTTVIEEDQDLAEVLLEAQGYLESRNVRAAYSHRKGSAATAILETAESLDSDLILMGGYGLNPMLEVVLGSTVGQVLRESTRPILFCR
ncbi:MAG: universal stress protein [Anaerolineales bacterium]